MQRFRLTFLCVITSVIVTGLVVGFIPSPEAHSYPVVGSVQTQGTARGEVASVQVHGLRSRPLVTASAATVGALFVMLGTIFVADLRPSRTKARQMSRVDGRLESWLADG